jgi:hypothetical protein
VHPVPGFEHRLQPGLELGEEFVEPEMWQYSRSARSSLHRLSSAHDQGNDVPG